MTPPTNTTLHLVSSLDETTARLAAVLGPARGTRLLVIETARLAEGRSFAPDDPLPFAAQGFDITLCDLKSETPESLADLLGQVSGCVLLGGNTFVLMQALHETGFDAALRARQARRDPSAPAFPIVGESAGAVVMGHTISHVATMDDPDLASRRIDSGLGWVAARVLPHRGCPHWGFGEAVERLIAADPDPASLMIIDEDGLLTFHATA